ncbi:MAG: hypothetical protein M3Q19_05960 [Pseudomonadota bacterium]|nr:hypothetical protein [Pseudomonadota bacterium]
MARYFFHTNHPAEQGLQDEGMEFASIHALKCGAVKYAGERLCDVAEHFWDSRRFELTVTDDQGLTLFTLRVVAIEAAALLRAR